MVTLPNEMSLPGVRVVFCVALALCPLACFSGRTSPPPALPTSLTCDGGALPGVAKDPLPLRPQVPGAQTPEAKSAKRLYDEERWAAAKTALARVAAGETGDDLGNRQLAAYQEAVTLFRLGELTGAARIFSEIARERSHVRHGETLLWLAKIAPQVPELTRSLAFYTEDDITKYDNADQRDTFWQLAYLLGRERLDRGLPGAASRLFVRVNGPLKKYAQRCLVKASETPPQPL
jgi:hypothetical protein